MKRRFENVELLNILNRLRKNKKAIWKRVRALLSLATRKRVSVNINKLSKLAKKENDSYLVVPGKVLGAGMIKNKFKVISFEYSKTALDKIKSAGCESYRLSDVVDDNGKIKVNGEFVIVR